MKSKIIIKECPIHGQTEFYVFERKNRPGPQITCKKCNIERVAKRKQDMKQKIVDYLGGKCSKCGYDSGYDKCNAALDLHHINPNKKVIEPSKLYGRSWNNIKEEVDKCILLCNNCHKKAHQGNITGRPVGKNTTKRTKIFCNSHQKETEHYLINEKWKCCLCNSEAVSKSLEKSRNRIFEYMGNKCSLCNETNIYLMEFHHKEPKNKCFGISEKMKLSWVKIQSELDKCIMVCGNCHREIHNGLPGGT